jgi:hypothetical protein
MMGGDGGRGGGGRTGDWWMAVRELGEGQYMLGMHRVATALPVQHPVHAQQPAWGRGV